MLRGTRLKITYLGLMLVIITSMFVLACSPAAPSTTSKPATSSPTTSAPTTTKPATTAPATTTAAPASDKSGGTLKMALTAGLVGSLGYMPELGNSAGVSLQAIIERLLILKMDGSVQPELATSWKVADDRKSITLNLRKGVKFHDGSDFNADVAKWNLDLQIKAKKSDVANWTSVDVIDPYTLRIGLTTYTNTLFSALGKLSISGMASKDAFDKKGIEYVRANPIGTGPFMFVEYQRDAKLTLKKNPNYWDAPKPYLDGIVMSVIPDDTVRRLSFEKGDIIGYSPTSPATAKELEQSGKYNLVLRTTGPRVLAPNSMDPKSPWSDVRVRYAASYSLDRELLATALGSGHSTPPYQIMQSQKDVAIAGLIPTKFNLDKSKQLLLEAGYPTGFKSTITGRPTIITTDQVSAVAAMLRKAGIDVTIDTVTSAKYDSMRLGGTWDGVLAESMLVQANKNDTFITYFTALQWQYTKRPLGFQEALNASISKLDIDPAAIKTIIQILYDDMTVIPFYEEDTASFENKGFHLDYNYADYNSPDSPRFANIWLDKNLR
jgi:peptide/nickel transport system substrate-binding protein